MATSAENPFPSSVEATPDAMRGSQTSGGGTGTSSTYGSSTSSNAPVNSGASASNADSNGSSNGTTTTGPTDNDLLNRVVQGAHETIDRLASTAAPHVQRLQDGVASASETLHTRADQVRATGDEWTESLRATVRENPLAAVATAVALGVLIARLTQSRN